MKETILKVLSKDLVSTHQNFKYEIGKWYHCDNFNTDKTVSCSDGFYGVGVEGLPYVFRHKKDQRVFICEVKGKNVNYDCYKRRWEWLRIVKEINQDTIKQMAYDKSAELGYDLFHAIFPVNPLTDIRKHKVTQIDKDNLVKWDSVGDSVWDSVWDSVRDSVRDSVWDSVWDSVRDSVWDSVRDSVRDSVWDSVRDSVWDSVRASVGAYISSLFPNIKKWKDIDHEEGVNPFQPCIDLWNREFVPSFDGKTWRLHQGKDAKVVYEWTEN